MEQPSSVSQLMKFVSTLAHQMMIGLNDVIYMSTNKMMAGILIGAVLLLRLQD